MFQQSDPVLHKMLNTAEANFMPKTVFTSSDWLKTQRENGQDIATYKRGGPEIQWHNPIRAGTIYLFVIDDSIDDETLAKFKLYTEAFYHGV